MKIITSVTAMQQETDRRRRADEIIVFIPTMGFLHEGHLSLIREGKKHGNYTVLSIFVNPTQFGPEEDYEAYPQDFEQDVKAAAAEGVDAVFAPGKTDLYGPGHETSVRLENLPHHLCGLSRPTHFQGVATIVVKLFNIVKPHVAVFGTKDYQQLAVIRRLIKDLFMDIRIVGVPIIREKSGLAMSSRNAYLTENQQDAARSLYASLLLAESMVRDGETRAENIIRKARALILSCPDTAIDYIAVCDPDTLTDVETITGPVLMAVAVHIGDECRLIDNMLLAADEPGRADNDN